MLLIDAVNKCSSELLINNGCISELMGDNECRNKLLVESVNEHRIEFLTVRFID